LLPNIGPLEIGLVALLALLVFGPKRLPELGRSLGRSIGGFSRALKGEEDETDSRASLKPVDSADKAS
jgi:sec-independent protein translocase protein TatA